MTVGEVLQLLEPDARTAFHPTPSPLHGSHPHQGTRGERNRAAINLRQHPRQHPGKGIRGQGKGPAVPHGIGVSGHRFAGGEFSRHPQRGIHRPDGRRAGQGGGRTLALGAGPGRFLRPLSKGPGEGQSSDARYKGERGAHGLEMREMRRSHGDQARKARPVSGLLQLPRM